MKGYIILSSPRSGTNWLNSIANRSQTMGECSEWISERNLNSSIEPFQPAEFLNDTIERATTENGRFAVKIFPFQLKWANSYSGADFIQGCRKLHDIKLVLVIRNDRLGQAISFVRAKQTDQWATRDQNVRESTYDFEAIRAAYFFGTDNYSFWKTYLDFYGIEYETFVYEDLLPNPKPYIRSIATHLDVEMPDALTSGLKIQRNSSTEEWRARFLEDAEKYGIIGRTCPSVKKKTTGFQRIINTGMGKIRSLS